MNLDMLIIVCLNYDISIEQKETGEVEDLWLSGVAVLLWPMQSILPKSMNSSACYNKSLVTSRHSCTALLWFG